MHSLSQKQLLSADIVMFALYFVFDFIGNESTHYAFSSLVCFVVIYFFIAYMKMYMPKFCSSMKANAVMLIIGLAGTIAVQLAVNALGHHIEFYEYKLMYWHRMNSPFILMTAAALLNISRHRVFYSSVINEISSLSLLVYLIHENQLVRGYLRPNIWQYIYNHIGYDHLILECIVLGLLMFFSSAAAAFAYQKLLQKPLHRLCDKICIPLNVRYEKFIGDLSRLQ